MLTLKKGRTTKSEALCPTCWGNIKLYATLSGLMEWKLVERCECRHINDDVEWLFEEEPTFNAVKPADFYPHRVYLTTEEAQSDDPELLQQMEDLYAEEEEKFLHDVDHGWEESWH